MLRKYFTFDNSNKKIVRKFVILGLLLLAGSSMWGQANLAQQIGCPVYLPNAFTPNNDQVNDVFTIKHGEDCQIEELQLRIFDRWGRIVYELTDARAKIAWDGTFRGRPLPGGVYMLDVKIGLRNYQTKEFNTFSKKGSVVLVR